jgi:hypothetical protein
MSCNINTHVQDYWSMLHDEIRIVIGFCEQGTDILMSFVSKFIRQQMARYFSTNLELPWILDFGIQNGNPHIIRLGLGVGATNESVVIAYTERWFGTSLHPGSKFARASDIASLYSHFSIIKFACENDPTTAKHGCLKAAESGDLNIIELTYPIWLASKKKCSLNKIAITAAKNGHTFILEWAHKIGHRDIDMAELIRIAFLDDNLDMLRWIITTCRAFERDSYRNAMVLRQWSLLKWMREDDPNWNPKLCSEIAEEFKEIAEEFKDDEMLMWLNK